MAPEPVFILAVKTTILAGVGNLSLLQVDIQRLLGPGADFPKRMHAFAFARNAYVPACQGSQVYLTTYCSQLGTTSAGAHPTQETRLDITSMVRDLTHTPHANLVFATCRSRSWAQVGSRRRSPLCPLPQMFSPCPIGISRAPYSVPRPGSFPGLSPGVQAGCEMQLLMHAPGADAGADTTARVCSAGSPPAMQVQVPASTRPGGGICRNGNKGSNAPGEAFATAAHNAGPPVAIISANSDTTI